MPTLRKKLEVGPVQAHWVATQPPGDIGLPTGVSPPTIVERSSAGRSAQASTSPVAVEGAAAVEGAVVEDAAGVTDAAADGARLAGTDGATLTDGAGVGLLPQAASQTAVSRDEERGNGPAGGTCPEGHVDGIAHSALLRGGNDTPG